MILHTCIYLFLAIFIGNADNSNTINTYHQYFVSQYSPSSKEWALPTRLLPSTNDPALCLLFSPFFSHIFMFICDNLSAISIRADVEAGNSYLFS